MPDTVIFGDSMREPAMRHEVPVAIPALCAPHAGVSFPLDQTGARHLREVSGALQLSPGR